MQRVLFFAVLAALSACRCNPGPVGGVELGFRVAPETTSLDFGRVLEGTTVTRQVTLIAESRLTVSVSAEAPTPFSVQQTVEVPGGSQVDLPVEFLAGNGVASASLTLSVGDRTVSVPLTGIGVRPPECLPTAQCRDSVYSLEQDTCVESNAADETLCDPKSECLERGRCQTGLCVGVARSCDDRNLCTSDACAMGTGCVNTPVQCPRPANPCRVPVCDPTSGCGEADALDGTPCGSIDCVKANVCSSGTCTAVDTPDGFPCAPPIACLGPGACFNQVCTRADAGEWQPRWSAVVAGDPLNGEPALLAAGATLSFVSCGLRDEADAGADAGVDAGADDGGVDAGATFCALVSYTTTGFERFTAPFEDGGPRRLVSALPREVVLHDGRAHELYSGVTGVRLDTAFGAADVELVTLSDGGRLLATYTAQPGTLVFSWTDAGLAAHQRLLGEPSVLAADEDDALWAWSGLSGALERFQVLDDGGVLAHLAVLDAGAMTLAVAGGVAVVGGEQLVRFLGDGGAQVRRADWSDAGFGFEAVGRHVLAAPGTAVLFYRRCDFLLTSCVDTDKGTWVRAFDSETGALRWEAKVLPGGVTSRLIETSLVVGAPGGVAALVRADFDAGVGAFLEVFGEGRRVLLCPLPEQSAQVRAAAFGAGRLFVLVDRPDGGVRLEAFELNGLPLMETAWPRPGGVGGQRRALP